MHIHLCMWRVHGLSRLSVARQSPFKTVSEVVAHSQLKTFSISTLSLNILRDAHASDGLIGVWHAYFCLDLLPITSEDIQPC